MSRFFSRSATSIDQITQCGASELPDTNRRRLLLGLAAMSTAAAVGNDNAKAAISEAENPALVRLAVELPDVEAAYIIAMKHQRTVERKYGAIWPLAPDDITRPGTKSTQRFERSFKGGALYRKGEEHQPTGNHDGRASYQSAGACRMGACRWLVQSRLQLRCELAGADRGFYHTNG